MKNSFIRIILLILLLISAFSCISCKNECGHKEVVQTVYYKEIDGKVFKIAKCVDCDKSITVGEEFVVYSVANNENKVVLAQEKFDFEENPIILIKAGTYDTLQILAYGTNFICEEGVNTKKVIFHAGVGGAVVDGVNFNSIEGGGISFKENTYDITIKNCHFTYCNKIYSEKLIDNITIENCVFENVFKENEKPTAILIERYNHLTLKDCVFDGIGYNAIRAGAYARGGVVSVTGNVFKNVGSRVVYFVNLADVVSCTISNNYFYDNTDCVLNEGESDDTGLKKSSGVYIYAGGGTQIEVGINYWEKIPEKDKKFITNNCLYNPDEQILIS